VCGRVVVHVHFQLILVTAIVQFDWQFMRLIFIYLLWAVCSARYFSVASSDEVSVIFPSWPTSAQGSPTRYADGYSERGRKAWSLFTC